MLDILVEPNSIIAGLAAIVACLAALSAHRSYNVSKRALELAESESEARKSSISVYIADSFRVYDRKRKQVKCVFPIEYLNKSEANDSVVRVFLETHYVTKSNTVNHLITAHEQNSSEWLLGSAVPASLPINIQARSSITSWFIFGLSPVVEEAERITKYRIVAQNGSGEQATIES